MTEEVIEQVADNEKLLAMLAELTVEVKLLRLDLARIADVITNMVFEVVDMPGVNGNNPSDNAPILPHADKLLAAGIENYEDIPRTAKGLTKLGLTWPEATDILRAVSILNLKEN